MNRIRTARYVLTLLIASLGFWGMTAAEPGSTPQPAGTATEVKTEPMKEEAPDVIVNGQAVPAGLDGKTETKVLADGTKVERTGDRTEVSGNGNVNIAVTNQPGDDTTGIVQIISHQYTSTSGSYQHSVVSSSTQSTIEVNQ